MKEYDLHTSILQCSNAPMLYADIRVKEDYGRDGSSGTR